ncbi:peptide/nickel transport system ATP-binding protein [Evansella vedderi]|uniref:Nickel import system ATP-binding protein NikD n=1 Tax=Evansella vedderi TaxID=38282 RepID=A0ABT9ZZM2_9BACI|nr:ABC transporter ATP-binding protein [Evansella vedderi]MDQ0256693.1 peptide/nickel transport system ATP-binding protein [Evansella vedderi]
MPLVEVDDLSVSFKQYTKGFKHKEVKVIHNLSFSINAGEIVAVVGSSGSGKSLLAHAILGILPRNANVSGTIHYDGKELTPSLQEKLRGKELAFVPQSVNFLNPLMEVEKQVRGALKGKDSFKTQKEIFEKYNLSTDVEKLYPFQLSGGMARRILVSTAVINKAKFIIADEPTPGLDQTVVKEALSSFKAFADNGTAVMFITHDIQSALSVADKIAVFYAGTTVEVAPVEDFTGSGERLRHPYSKALWRALPQNEFRPIPGSQPKGDELPRGCLFAPRCDMTTTECLEHLPEKRVLRNGMVRCIHAT